MKYFSLLYQGDVHPSDEEKIIPKDEFSKLVSASEILDMAKEDAEKKKKEAYEEAEEIRKKAEEEGFSKGLEQFNTQIFYLENQMRQLRFEMQKMILPLALKAAKKIVGKELELHPQTIVEIVLQAIKPVTQNRKIIIWVNKKDKEILEANKPRIKEILEHVENLSIRERNDVLPGGCIIETEAGIINASLENQWRTLESAFETFLKP